MKKFIESSIAVTALIWLSIFFVDIITASANANYSINSIEDIFFNLITPIMLIVTMGYFAYKFTKFQPTAETIKVDLEQE